MTSPTTSQTTSPAMEEREPGADGAAPPAEGEDAALAETVETPEEADASEEARKFQDLYLRCAAEMENMRRRFQKEREEIVRFASESVVKGLLPVLDNLSLALSFVREDAPPETRSLAEGVRMTLKGLLDVLGENGLKRAPAERGGPFDPHLHEAIGQRPEADLPAGAVSQEVQPGYLLHGRLIRPAKVFVAAPNNTETEL